MNLIKIIENQFKEHKEIQIEDMYKLIYQSTFGCKHTIDKNAKDWLYKEFDQAESINDSEIVEMISSTNLLFRINIRPYKYHGGKKEDLFKWFYKTSKIELGSKDIFFANWKVFTRLNKYRGFFYSGNILEFEDHIKNLPIIHHSEGYKNANNPSYRVISYSTVNDKFIENLMLRL